MHHISVFCFKIILDSWFFFISVKSVILSSFFISIKFFILSSLSNLFKVLILGPPLRDDVFTAKCYTRLDVCFFSIQFSTRLGWIVYGFFCRNSVKLCYFHYLYFLIPDVGHVGQSVEDILIHARIFLFLLSAIFAIVFVVLV